MKGPTAFVNGRVLTMDDASSYAAELITGDGRVLAVGGPGLADGIGGDRVDLGGRTVIPGFVDAHCHLDWCALARRTRKGRYLSPEERIDIGDALRMFTADAAYACRLDDRGCLAPGKLADFVVLGRDPRELDIDELPGTPVDFTVLGGKVWYS